MSKPKRIHYRNREWSLTDDRAIFFCGKDVGVNHYKANSTTSLENITCPLCLKQLSDRARAHAMQGRV